MYVSGLAKIRDISLMTVLSQNKVKAWQNFHRISKQNYSYTNKQVQRSLMLIINR